MAKNINIYLNDESSSALENRKKKDPSFNISAFIQERLIQEDEEKIEDPLLIALEIDKKNSQIIQLRSEIAILEEKKFRIDTKKKMEQEEIEKEKIREERKKAESIKTWADNLFYFFGITKEMAQLIAEEIWETPKDERKTVFDEGKSRGLKEKEQK